MFRGLVTVGIVSIVLGMTGCQRLNYNTTFKLGVLGTHDIHFSAPAYNQRVVVTVTPTDSAVSSYLVKSEDHPAVERALQADKEPQASRLLGSRVSKGNPETYSFEATIPAKTEYSLVFKGSGRPTEVKVQIVGR